MGYLIAADFNRLIQDVTLQQVISSNPKLKIWAENTALTEVKSYLRAKYDIASEFTETAKYSPVSSNYKAGNRVYLDADYYNEHSTYVLNQQVLKIGKVYVCKTAITTPEAFTIGKWDLLGDQYEIFYAVNPESIFNLFSIYKKDDVVYWQGKTYTCVIGTQGISHDSVIQYTSTANLPYSNVFPDDADNGIKYWGAGTAYTIPVAKLLDTDYFVQGDNRNQQLVTYILDILIYTLYRRIPPAIVPEVRIMAYQSAISWLKLVAKGEDIVADIVKIQPPSGDRIRYGSKPKQINDY